MRIFIVCTSCKTSYIVLSHSRWGLGQFVMEGGGGSVEIPEGGFMKKTESLQILDLERLASLPGGQKKVDIVEWWLYWRGGKVVVKGGS